MKGRSILEVPNLTGTFVVLSDFPALYLLTSATHLDISKTGLYHILTHPLEFTSFPILC